MTKRSDNGIDRRTFLQTATAAGAAAAGGDPTKVAEWLAEAPAAPVLQPATLTALSDLSRTSVLYPAVRKTFENFGVRAPTNYNVRDYFEKELRERLVLIYEMLYDHVQALKIARTDREGAEKFLAQATLEYGKLKDREHKIPIVITGTDPAVEAEMAECEKIRSALENKYGLNSLDISVWTDDIRGKPLRDMMPLSLDRNPEEVLAMFDTLTGNLFEIHEKGVNEQGERLQLRKTILKELPNFIENRLPSMVQEIKARVEAEYPKRQRENAQRREKERARREQGDHVKREDERRDGWKGFENARRGNDIY